MGGESNPFCDWLWLVERFALSGLLATIICGCAPIGNVASNLGNATVRVHLANEDTSRLASERPQNRKTGKEQSFDKPSARRT